MGVLFLLVVAFTTPGFVSLPNMMALSGTVSLVGCVAVGMTFITISGNIMSFALGATAAATSMLIAHYSSAGAGMAIAIGLVFALAVSGIQGLIVGVFRANPLIVSIASLSLLFGTAQYFSGGQSLYVETNVFAWLKSRPFGLPAAMVVFVAIAILGELILRFTRFGQHILLVGSNINASVVAGIRTWRTVLGCYALAGLCAGVCGLLLAARFGSGTMEFGIGYDYSAISAVLVGGTAIAGGSGSVLRTVIGVLVIAVLQSILLLRGFETQYQYFLIGVIVLLAILVQGRRVAS
ncbi:ABC transporter permease [Pusillimonas sp. T2]|uniref:ABC transporter permease n=1 Tax=Pusillimonas sp. T2 TaxID=1548123 RepID=UPI0013037213|nr:ABC transporter permease [Pusillimonas sp. T2]